MTPADRWNSFASSADLYVALAILLAGIILLIKKRTLSEVRKARVSKGELTKDEANRIEKLTNICSLALVAFGFVLVSMELF
jgi:hypothetical protein